MLNQRIVSYKEYRIAYKGSFRNVPIEFQHLEFYIAIFLLFFIQVGFLCCIFPISLRPSSPSFISGYFHIYMIITLISFLISILFEKANTFFNKFLAEDEFLNVSLLLVFSQVVFLRSIFFELMHEILPGKNKRDQEILAFKEVFDQKNDAVLDERNSFKKGQEAIKKSFEENFDLFLSKRINLTGSIKRLILERIKDENEILNCNKLLFLNLIPKSLEIPSDMMREIILANTLMTNSFNWDLKTHEVIMSISKNNLDSWFQNVTINEIKNIFTRPFDFETYVNFLLETNSLNKETKFEPMKNLSDLIEESETTKNLRKNRLRNPNLLNMKKQGYKIQILLTKKEFTEAGKTFVNCVRNYQDSQTDVFTVKNSDGTPLACVEVSHKIVQISGIQNNDLRVSDRTWITEMVNSALKAS